jgi:hypothetical protein
VNVPGSPQVREHSISRPHWRTARPLPESLLGISRRWLADEEKLGDAVWRLLCFYVLSIPFSIALAQSLLVTTCIVATRHWQLSRRSFPRTSLDVPIASFLCANILAAFVGLDFWQAIWGSRSFLLAVTVYLIVGYASNIERVVTLVQFFLGAMTVTSAHTVLDAIGPWSLPDPFPRSMSESGQLLLRSR